MQSAFQRFYSDNGVKIIGRTDINGLQTGNFEQIMIVFEYLRNAVLFCQSLCLFYFDIADGDDFHIVHAGIAGHMSVGGNSARADNADFEFPVHSE